MYNGCRYRYIVYIHDIQAVRQELGDMGKGKQLSDVEFRREVGSCN